MSVQELKRQEVMSRVSRNELGLKDAAALMEVSYRQAKRIWRRYKREGAQGVMHRSAGRRSSRSKPAAFREQVLATVREKYSGDQEHRFGPTLAAEHLSSEDGLEVDAETLRRWMLALGAVEPGTKKEAVPATTRASEALRRVGPVRWKSARLVRRPEPLLHVDEHGGRCDQHESGIV